MSEQLVLQTVSPEDEGNHDSDYVLDEKNYLAFQVHAGNLHKEGWSVLFSHLNRLKATTDKTWNRIENGQNSVGKINDRLDKVEEALRTGVGIPATTVAATAESGVRHFIDPVLTQHVEDIIWTENKKAQGQIYEIFKKQKFIYLGDIVCLTEAELRGVGRIGEGLLEMIAAYLRKHNLYIGCISKHWHYKEALIECVHFKEGIIKRAPKCA